MSDCPCSRCRNRDNVTLYADVEILAECCKTLLDAGADPNGMDISLLTPILTAAQEGDMRKLFDCSLKEAQMF